MKRMMTAAVAAVALVGATVQEASAWCKFNFSTGVSIGWETGGGGKRWGNYQRWTSPPPYGSGGYGGFGGPPMMMEAAPAPTPVPNAPAVKPMSGIQTIGYYTYPGYDQNMPTVWWGN